MNRINYIAILSATWLTCLFSCKKVDVNDFASKRINTDPFYEINIKGVFDVYFIQDTIGYLEFKGTEDMLAKSTASVQSGELTIANKHASGFLQPQNENEAVYIHVDSLTRINVSEACNIRSLNALTTSELGVVVGTRMMEAVIQLNCKVFYYWNNPSGVHLKLTGNVNELKLWNSGLALIDAQQLNAKYVLCENGSQGNCYVNATAQLDYSLTNTGNIYYFGNPSAINELKPRSTGNLIKGD